jgi:hypothetical protein
MVQELDRQNSFGIAISQEIERVKKERSFHLQIK